MNTIELIKDVCLFGGSVPNERIIEVREFLDKLLKEQNEVKNLTISDVINMVCPNCGEEHTETDCCGYCTAACLQGY